MDIKQLEDNYKEIINNYGKVFLELARKSIICGLENGKPLKVNLTDYPQELQEAGAVFVTLEKKGFLRGCIGSAFAHQPLIKDIVDNAFSSAFNDPRFPDVEKDELDEINISISILTPALPLSFSSEEDLIEQIRPQIDGLIIEENLRRGLFLPMVWEQLSDKKDFLSHLKMKAGLPSDYWSNTIKISRFSSVVIKE